MNARARWLSAFASFLFEGGGPDLGGSGVPGVLECPGFGAVLGGLGCEAASLPAGAWCGVAGGIPWEASLHHTHLDPTYNIDLAARSCKFMQFR